MRGAKDSECCAHHGGVKDAFEELVDVSLLWNVSHVVARYRVVREREAQLVKLV